MRQILAERQNILPLLQKRCQGGPAVVRKDESKINLHRGNDGPAGAFHRLGGFIRIRNICADSEPTASQPPRGPARAPACRAKPGTRAARRCTYLKTHASSTMNTVFRPAPSLSDFLSFLLLL